MRTETLSGPITHSTLDSWNAVAFVARPISAVIRSRSSTTNSDTVGAYRSCPM